MQSNYKTKFSGRRNQEFFKEIPVSENDIFLQIIKNNYSEIIKEFLEEILSLDIIQGFRLIFLSIPQNSDDKNEILISILFELLISLPNLSSFIYMGPEVDYICDLLVRNRSLSSIKFISEIITIQDIFTNIFEQIIQFLIQNYNFLDKIAKDFGRLFIINSVTMDMLSSEICDVIMFLERNFLDTANNFYAICEIIDFFEIIDILTISLIHVPIGVISEIISIFSQGLMKFKKSIFIHDNLRLMCLSIYANLNEEGFEIQGFNWKSLVFEKDINNSQLFQKAFRLLFYSGEARFDERLPYKCKEMLKNFEEECGECSER